MQKVIAFLFAAALASTVSFTSQAQAVIQPGIIESYPLEITNQKTTNLVFPHTIVGVDKGSREILAQKAKGAGNILQVKSSGDNFQETNLTVITGDGKLYSFLLNFSPYPEALNLVFHANGPASVQLSSPNKNEGLIEAAAAAVAEQKKTLRKKKDKKFGITFQLCGLYIQNDVLYYQLRLTNDTHVSYDIGQLRFFIRDKRRSRRTANQELEMQPLYVNGNTQKIEANSESVLVYAMPKHTIPDKKYLAMQLMENNGGRHLDLKVNNRTLVKALPLQE